MGELEERPKEHIAGGIAKLAYKSLKESGRLEEEEVEIKQEEIDALEIAWAVLTLSRLKGVDFPVDKEILKERLKGIVVKEKDKEFKIEELLERIEYPVKSPAELLHKIKVAAG